MDIAQLTRNSISVTATLSFFLLLGLSRLPFSISRSIFIICMKYLYLGVTVIYSFEVNLP